MEEFSKNPEICEQFLKPRSSRSQMFFKMDFLEDFALFTGKHLCWSLFLTKLQTFMSATFIKKRLQHRCFPVNIAKSLRRAFL